LKSKDHGWNNLGEKVLAENDYGKQTDLRRHATADADVFLASVNAVAETGELIAVDGTGSRVGAFPFVAKKLILVISTQKIMPTVEAAMKRIREYVRPLEDKRMMGVYGVGTLFGKWIIIEEERMPERIQVILVKEKLGF
jgi:L-lactate utilization protein LutC